MGDRRPDNSYKLMFFKSVEQRYLPSRPLEHSRLGRQGQVWCWRFLKKGTWGEKGRGWHLHQREMGPQGRSLWPAQPWPMSHCHHPSTTKSVLQRRNLRHRVAKQRAKITQPTCGGARI